MLLGTLDTEAGVLRMCPLRLDLRSRQLYERFVPPDHALRELDEAVDFSFLQLASVSSDLFGTLVDGTSYTWTGQVKTAIIHGASGATVGLNQSYYGVDNIAQGTNPYGALWLQQLGGLVDRRLAYDRVGNVTGLTDVSDGNETLTYTYDHLDRLTDAGNGGSYAESFGYGTTGNLTVKNGQGLGYTDPNHPHAVTGYAGTSDAYDQNGALTQRQSGGVTTTLTYDHAHRVLRVATGAGTICRYAYDGDGNRTKRLDQNGVIHYVGDLYERNLGYGGNQQNRETRYYYAQLGSEHRLLGFRTRSSGTDAPLTIVGTDHLGGTIATASGTTGTPITGRLRYTPFGEARGTSGDFGTDRGFTGQTRDAVAGTYWYKSRFYDSVVGRFCQPDTVVPGAGNPQAWNRYAYVQNNPLRCVDPSGHASVLADDGWGGPRITTVPENPAGGPRVTTAPQIFRGSNVTIVMPLPGGPNITVVEPVEGGPRIFTDGELGKTSGVYLGDTRDEAGIAPDSPGATTGGERWAATLWEGTRRSADWIAATRCMSSTRGPTYRHWRSRSGRNASTTGWFGTSTAGRTYRTNPSEVESKQAGRMYL